MKFKSLLILIIAIINLQLYAFGQGSAIYVDASASGNNDGSNWANAYTSLSNAINTVHTAFDISIRQYTYDTIYIAEGTYLPDLIFGNVGQDVRDVSFIVNRDNLAIIGGFAKGGIAYDPSIYHTVLSGKIYNTNTRNKTLCLFKIYSPTYNRINQLNPIHFENITFKHNNHSPNNHYYPTNLDNQDLFGAALYVRHISVNLKNCDFTENESHHNGAALLVLETDVNIENSRFYNNYANYAGAIYSFRSSIKMKHTTVENNEAFLGFGGMELNTTSIWGFVGSGIDTTSIEIDSCIIRNNRALNHTVGGFSANSTNTILKNSLIEGNVSRYRSVGGFQLLNGNVTVTNNIIRNNEAPEGHDAVVIANSNKVTFTKNIISHHKSNAYIISIKDSKESNFSENIIANNTNKTPGSSPYMLVLNRNNVNKTINNLFVNNYARKIVMFYSTDPNFRNNIYYNNVETQTNLLGVETLPTSKNNYIHNNSNLIDNLNGSLDPMFVKPDSIFEHGNYRLQFCSPLINAGSNYGITANTDILGRTRIIDSLIDIGPYEKQSNDTISKNATLASLSHNGIVLSPTCEEDGWTYYATSNAADSVVLGIKWDSANAVVKNKATVMIKVDSTHTLLNNGSNQGIATLPRYWNIDIDTNILVSPIAIRFYYAKEEIDAIQSHFRTEGIDSLDAPVWFTMNEAFIPNLHVVNNDINNGNYTILTPNIDTLNGIISVQFDSLNVIHSGGAYVKGYRSVTANRHFSLTKKLNLYPNPATHLLHIDVNDIALIDQEAKLIDMYGSVLKTITLQKINSIDVSAYPSGIYMIKLQDVVIKFIKD